MKHALNLNRKRANILAFYERVQNVRIRIFHAQNERQNVPIRSSTMLPGYISLSGGKIAGIHV